MWVLERDVRQDIDLGGGPRGRIHGVDHTGCLVELERYHVEVLRLGGDRVWTAGGVLASFLGRCGYRLRDFDLVQTALEGGLVKEVKTHFTGEDIALDPSRDVFVVTVRQASVVGDHDADLHWGKTSALEQDTERGRTLCPRREADFLDPFVEDRLLQALNPEYSRLK
jgi:hypothetical protein